MSIDAERPAPACSPTAGVPVLARWLRRGMHLPLTGGARARVLTVEAALGSLTVKTDAGDLTGVLPHDWVRIDFAD